ncbi:phenol 2-monooxygenase P0 subunit [Sphaerotilus hippei]|uniref:Phenol 2-monooxygenase P0 subunit n=1 Tax=Sphaerotilus hippei TaxID=744406 RepID=A0A318GVS8_9BURK|nr:phenol hydroxylase subunit [Sphaerotilus hippei]PXW92302.1 phenol 2-monooxygenase P0 subunit [Sphaerotilus hippei]
MTVLDFPGAMPEPHTVCWVRVRQQRPDGFVEFDFAIGEPELSVDLILPRPAFEAFCVMHRVRLIDDAQAARLDAEQAKWRYGRPGLSD